MKTTVFMIALSLLSVSAFAQGGKGNGPCEQIIAACTGSNPPFIAGDYKAGKGLMVDCFCPLVKGHAQPKTATIPLPTIASTLPAACIAANPKKVAHCK
jgi:hypothetical protein